MTLLKIREKPSKCPQRRYLSPRNRHRQRNRLWQSSDLSRIPSEPFYFPRAAQLHRTTSAGSIPQSTHTHVCPPVALLCYIELNEPQRGIHRFRIESLSQNGQGSAESRTERHQDPSRGERSLGDHPK